MTDGKEAVYDEVRNIRNAISMERNECYGNSAILTAIKTNIERNAVPEKVPYGKNVKALRISALIIGILVGTFLTLLVLLSVAMATWCGLTAEKCQRLIHSDLCVKENNSLLETQQTVEELKKLVSDLRSQLDYLNDSLQYCSSLTHPTTDSMATDSKAADNQTTSMSPTMSAKPTSSMIDQDVSITLNNVSLFMDCTTSIERTCTIITTEAQCTTGFGATYQTPGEFIMDISCVRVTPASADQNGMSFILTIDSTNNEVECLCYIVTIVTGSSPTRRTETCGLRVTRCRTFSNITTTATISRLP